MYVEIDISENLKKIDCDSILGVATPDGKYKKTIKLSSEIKKRIENYSGVREPLHSILIFLLIKDELKKYTKMKICHDVSKNKLHNCLNKLFTNNEDYMNLQRSKSIKIRSVKGSFIDWYVKRVRSEKNGFKPDMLASEKEIKELLSKFK